MVMDGQIVMQNVRRYRAIASFCRQTAALRPLQKWSLLDQAEGWERLAAEERISSFAIAWTAMKSCKAVYDASCWRQLECFRRLSPTMAAVK
jgi:hypothetical protein